MQIRVMEALAKYRAGGSFTILIFTGFHSLIKNVYYYTNDLANNVFFYAIPCINLIVKRKGPQPSDYSP